MIEFAKDVLNLNLKNIDPERVVFLETYTCLKILGHGQRGFDHDLGKSDRLRRRDRLRAGKTLASFRAKSI